MPKPEQGGMWGILGGTFDPVHNGHIILADEICRQKALSGVLFIPAYRHPFKDNEENAPYAHRVNMLRLALEESEPLRVDEIEAAQELSGYTLDTVRALKKTYPEAEFRFIIGADNIEQIDRWHEPDKLLQEVPMIAGARPGYHLQLDDRIRPDRIELVETKTPDISSTQIRRMIREEAGDNVLAEYLPARVVSYIRKEQLYT